VILFLLSSNAFAPATSFSVARTALLAGAFVLVSAKTAGTPLALPGSHLLSFFSEHDMFSFLLGDTFGSLTLWKLFSPIPLCYFFYHLFQLLWHLPFLSFRPPQPQPESAAP